jgi:indole-3-glycerol phosphate synthase
LESRAELERLAARAPAARRFAAALRRPNISVVAEVKRRSPSKGWINRDLSAVDQAHAYERGGAAAISVLTEPAHFGGSNDDLRNVLAAVGVPVLKKDFHVQPIQLTEARALGASAALVIARALSPAALRSMIDCGRDLGLELLVEVRDEDELARALEYGSTVIGINNRNLETLVIEPGTAERLLGLIPPNVIAIAESGISGRMDVERVARYGADAVLVGSSISASEDPVVAVGELSNVRRASRER